MPIRFGCLCCTLSLAIVSFVVEPVHAGEAQWVEVRSPNFSVVTDAGEKRGRDVALHFEQMRGVFGTLMQKAKVTLPVPLQIVAFRNTKELRQFAPLFHGKPTEVAGLFQAGADRSYIMLDMSTENPWSVVFHEYAHQLMNGNISAEMHPWFEEGFAEFFSSIEVDSKEARVGKIPPEEYLILRQDGMMKIADLFRVQQNSKTYNESGDHRTVFYAESAMVVHFIYDNLLIPKVAVYFDRVVDQKMPVDNAIQQAFGISAVQFDGALRKYVDSGRYKYYAIPTPPGVASSTFTVAPLGALDAKAIMADVHLRSPEYQEKALQEFQEILKEQPNHATALRGLGYAYLEKQDFAHAGEYFRRAAQADSKDSRVHYYSALLTSREGFVADPTKRLEMKKELETSIALDPNYADAYSLLAFAQSSSGDHDGALQSARKALNLSPRNEGYLFNLAQILMGAQKVDEAIALLQNLAKSQNAEMSTRAQQTLMQAMTYKDEMKSYESRKVAVVTGEQLVNRALPEHSSRPERDTAPEQVIPPSGPAKFLKGKLTSVDCSSSPAAVLAILSGTKTWKMHVRDSGSVVVIGADNFSCGWTNQKLAVNYRQTGDGEGDVISLEVQ